MSAVIPFEIAVSDEQVADLHRRLDETRWPPPGPADGWAAGADAAYVKDIVASWRGFDWRAAERRLNALPHYVTEIDGQLVHFVWRRSASPGAVPLIMTHGWPSSFLEYVPLIDRLADPAASGSAGAPAFDVVVPSLPGFGFSGIPRQPGMSPRRIAGLWVKLMERLGYGRFCAFGCDWGAYVTALIGLDHPERVDAIQMGYLSLTSRDAKLDPSIPDEKAYADRRRVWLDREFGYFHLQGTKPSTIGIALNDSPAGLAAWIVEKWRGWSDGDLDAAIARETTLANLSLYWFTQTASSAGRIYYESQRDPVALGPGRRVEVPSAFYMETSRQPVAGETQRMGGAPRRLAQAAFDVRHWYEAPRGGHFPALETPDLLCEQIRSFFGGVAGTRSG